MVVGENYPIIVKTYYYNFPLTKTLYICNNPTSHYRFVLQSPGFYGLFSAKISLILKGDLHQ